MSDPADHRKHHSLLDDLAEGAMGAGGASPRTAGEVEDLTPVDELEDEEER